MMFQVVTAQQCCNNMLTILFIVGRTTLFTPVDINLEQVVDFLNFYACSYLCKILSYTLQEIFSHLIYILECHIIYLLFKNSKSVLQVEIVFYRD
jgi:hypothetical protein